MSFGAGHVQDMNMGLGKNLKKHFRNSISPILNVKHDLALFTLTRIIWKLKSTMEKI